MIQAKRDFPYEGKLLRVEHVQQPGRPLPYEFVERLGAVTIVPIITDNEGNHSVMTIRNERTHYGVCHELPGGNFDGEFDQQENPFDAALRELKEETGYVPEDDSTVDVFKMRNISRTIIYPRYIAVARKLEYSGGEISNPSEVITPEPTAVETYLDGILDLSREEAYPEMTLAFAKAAKELGRSTLLGWLVSGANNAQVSESFKPWMQKEPLQS